MSETARQWDDGADYYSTSADTERLSHEELGECIWEHLEGCGGTIEEAAIKGLTVCAWKRLAIDVESEAKRRLDSFVEDVCQDLAEEFGEPGGDWDGGPTIKEAEDFTSVALPALKTLISKVQPWRCNVVGERTFTAEELLAWVRENEPEWLEKKS